MQERIYKTQAVVLRRYDFGEAGRQLVVFTPHLGKLSVLAKGVKRATSKLAGHVEPLCLSHIVVARGRNLDTLTQAHTVEAFARARSDPDKLFHALLVAELLDKLTAEHEENVALWNLFVETLRRIDSEPDPWVAGAYYHAWLLDLSGYRPELMTCVACGGPLSAEAVFYSPRLGGAVCTPCRSSDPSAFPASANGIKVLRSALSTTYDQFRRLKVPPALRSEIDALLRENLRRMLDIETGSAGLLDALRGADRVMRDES